MNDKELNLLNRILINADIKAYEIEIYTNICKKYLKLLLIKIIKIIKRRINSFFYYLNISKSIHCLKSVPHKSLE